MARILYIEQHCQLIWKVLETKTKYFDYVFFVDIKSVLKTFFVESSLNMCNLTSEYNLNVNNKPANKAYLLGFSAKIAINILSRHSAVKFPTLIRNTLWCVWFTRCWLRTVDYPNSSTRYLPSSVAFKVMAWRYIWGEMCQSCTEHFAKSPDRNADVSQNYSSACLTSKYCRAVVYLPTFRFTTVYLGISLRRLKRRRRGWMRAVVDATTQIHSFSM